MKKLISILIAAAMSASIIGSMSAAAEENTSSVLAFPGAEGGGMYSAGARAAQDLEVYHVTNLNDSGEGSFRDAVSKSGRFVVFDVSGMIDLLSNVTIKSNTTILGQTAPGDGICIRGNNVKVGGNDIILRYIRFRVGAHLADGSDTRAQDGLEVTDNCQNVIIDHCSVSWGTDENLSAYAVKNVTIQNCIIAEALNQSVHDKGEHSYAAIWGGVNLTVHHNLIASHKSRNPKIGTSETVSMTDGYSDKDTLVDIRNNVIYNWGDKAGYGAENGANVNIINNYYKPGPATPEKKRARIFELSPGNKYQSGWSGAIYADGNYIDDNGSDAQAVNTENWQIEAGTGVYLGSGVDIYQKLDSANEEYISDYPITTTSAEDAYIYVLNNAGARLPKTDVVDERIINDVINGTGVTGSKGSTGLADDPTDTIPEGEESLYDDRGYPIWESETRAEDYDTDGDGIPNVWETAHGLNPENPTDSLFVGAMGYTFLELYANSIGNDTDAGLDIETDGKTVTVSANSDIFADVYADGEKIGTAQITADSVSDSVKINAVYNADGRLIAAYTDMENIPEIAGAAKAKQLKWNSLNGMEPVETTGSAELELPSLSRGTHIISAVSFDGELSDVKYVYSTPEITASEQIDGDFAYALNIGDVPTVSEEGYTSLVFASDGSTYEIGVGSKDYKKTIYLNGETVDLGDISLIKIEKKNGKITVSGGESMFDLNVLKEEAFSGSVTTVTAKDGENYAADITVERIENTTQPQIEILDIEENQRLGFNSDINVKITPDGETAVKQVIVRFNGETIGFKETDITLETSITIPVTFEQVSSGTLEVLCADENLCSSSDSVNVSVSADITPWQIADIGVSDGDTKTHVAATNDYTYKINTYNGQIGSLGDKCGYVYQQFTGDNRIYYRSRMQDASQFGVMLRSGLDSTSSMCWFGGVYEDGTLKYKLLVRSADSENVTEEYTLDNQSKNLYFIAEREGNTFNIYQTENGSSVYKTKELLHSTDCSFLGNEYYMGFASAGGSENPADAGWIALDNNSGDNYLWTFDNGLDWLWQKQEMNVLNPEWTSEAIGGNSTGKMKIAPDDGYESDRYIFREYVADDNLMPAMSADFLITGENPAMNIYFQTGNASSAYKAEISDGILKIGDTEIGSIEGSKWYTLKIRTDMTTDGAVGYATLSTLSGEVINEDVVIEETSDFREQNNVEKKTPVTKAVYFEPVSGAEGTYYIDNVSVEANEASIKVTKTQSCYVFGAQSEGVFSSPITIEGTTAFGGNELSGNEITVSAGEIKDTGKSKTIDGITLSGKCRIKGEGKKITVPVSSGAQISVYAASASSSSERVLVINDTEFPIKEAQRVQYTYEGDQDTIEIYAKDNIDVYGISVTVTEIE